MHWLLDVQREATDRTLRALELSQYKLSWGLRTIAASWAIYVTVHVS